MNVAVDDSQNVSLMTSNYDARIVGAGQDMPMSRMNLMRRTNSMAWVWFLVGMAIGGHFGFFIATVLIANKIAELERKGKDDGKC